MSDQFESRQAAARTRAAARKQVEQVVNGQDGISIVGPNPDGSYAVEFSDGRRPCDPDTRGETAVIEHFQKRMPNGLVVWAP